MDQQIFKISFPDEEFTKDNLNEKLNNYYAYLNFYNKFLLTKINNKKEFTFMDVIDFPLTGALISLLHSYFDHNINSKSNLLIVRFILEYYALKEMYKQKGLDKENIELFKLQSAIVDYKQYVIDFSKHNDIVKGINHVQFGLDMDTIKKTYQNALDAYSKYGKDESFVLEKNLPFLLDKKININGKIISNNDK